MNHIYIFLTILLTVYGQIVIKWQVNLAGAMPVESADKIGFMIRLLLNPWIMTGFASAFLAAISWMGAMSKFPISYAYPFMSLAFVIVLILSNLFFKEPITISKSIGMGLIVLGIIFGSRS
ncbi:MAG: EamA family transporter [Cyanobacteria bacterium]|nr:EamA family transporter [Cyanobacteria bacterium CG_2015-16_32_12]NCO78481.1 EamA family transporter [Cyanobacteria bacterium CG_2015-22_32_23]NCQ04259.1 EamA family transporter [Cyanobacteria bacterium CG_2015-09_32_10]NCQ40625.1 EamA family transporter [Cyanobacteria bacterium CG_2015-04_32_10]NCS83554.1 EamA family transporter [Cyanobacteria bacterium CG_2015-02_32_10]